MASDLISRSALLAEYDRVHVGETGGARKLIEESPAVDSEPVRHGHWIEHPTIFKYISHWECSACNSWHGERGMNYCPNCGAKMDGGKQETW